jgi:hypothetical protein
LLYNFVLTGEHGAEWIMHILTFDRLSKALVIGGAGLLALGLLIACLKAHRIQETDSAVFWLFVAVTLVVLVLGTCLGWGETTTRFVGLGFQIVGILVALYAVVSRNWSDAIRECASRPLDDAR